MHDITDEVEAQVRVTVPVVSSAIAGAIAVGFATWIAPMIGLVIALVCLAIAVVSAVAYRLEARALGRLVDARAEVVRVSELVTSQADELRAIGGWGSATRWLDEAHHGLGAATRSGVLGRALAAGAILLVIGAATIASAAIATGLDVSNPVKALLVLAPVAMADAFSPLADAMRARAQARAAARHGGAAGAGPRGPRPRRVRSPGWRCADGLVAGGPAAPKHHGLVGPPSPSPIVECAERAAGRRPVRPRSGTGRVGRRSRPERQRQVDPAGRPGPPPRPGLRQLHGDHSDGERDVLAEPLDEARARIAVVDDEPHVFGTTLRNNLTLARPGATDEAVLEALGRAGLSRLTSGLPGRSRHRPRGGRPWPLRRGAGPARHRPGPPERQTGRRARRTGRPPRPSHRAQCPDRPARSLARLDDRSPAVVLVTHRPDGLDLVDRVFTVTHPHR